MGRYELGVDVTSVCFYVQLLEFLASSFFLFLELSLTRLFVINSSSLSFVHVSYLVDFYVPYFYSSTSFITPLSVFLSVRLYMLLPFFRELEPRWLFAPSFVRIIGLNRMFIFFSIYPHSHLFLGFSLSLQIWNWISSPGLLLWQINYLLLRVF